jgi:uncharacterized protein YpmS
MNNNSTKWKWAFFISIAVFVTVIVFMGYGLLDQGITITYMSDGYERTENDLNRLAEIFPKNYNKKDILYLLRKNNPDAFIVEDECAVQINGLRFEFDQNGKLKNINTRAEYSSEYECESTEQPH